MKITICGSMAFHAEMEKIGTQLRIEAEGEVATESGIEAFPHDHPVWDEKADAIDDHFQKVAWSDVILIANEKKHDIDGYIGGNTLMEMAVARYLRKKIYVLVPIAPQLSYKEEILGMHPIVIHEDLTLIM